MQVIQRKYVLFSAGGGQNLDFYVMITVLFSETIGFVPPYLTSSDLGREDKTNGIPLIPDLPVPDLRENRKMLILKVKTIQN